MRVTNSNTRKGQVVIYSEGKQTTLGINTAVDEDGLSVAPPLQLFKRHKIWLWIFTGYFPTPKSAIHYCLKNTVETK